MRYVLHQVQCLSRDYWMKVLVKIFTVDMIMALNSHALLGSGCGSMSLRLRRMTSQWRSCHHSSSSTTRCSRLCLPCLYFCRMAAAFWISSLPMRPTLCGCISIAACISGCSISFSSILFPLNIADTMRICCCTLCRSPAD